tara:strand:+ start:93041 stop:93574 length:534 start_codon:yes stop_codon:yes gene_type:complete
MLSVMLGLGIVSRIASGMIADKIGGLGTIMLGAALQCVALAFLHPVRRLDDIICRYILSLDILSLACSGSHRAGSCPVTEIVRAVLPGQRSRHPGVSGAHDHRYQFGHRRLDVRRDFWPDWSYQIAFLNGIAWNLLNVAITFWLLIGTRRPPSRPQDSLPQYRNTRKTGARALVMGI